MSNDVFLSYSRKDSDEALDLAEQLRLEGISVWMDRNGIGGAKQWASEIATAIRNCSVFLLLVSDHAVASENVLREVVLASDRGKRILPVILRRTPIPISLEYHLAGIHYLHYVDFKAIVSTLRGTTGSDLPNISDHRKSLLVLPFEDLSPAQDNGWFSDGLTSELISTLSKIKALRVIDWNTSKGFKGARGHTRDIARDLDVRYFLEGNVRKFENQIKISVELLDIKTGDFLWHDSHKGVFADIFEIQELVATKIATGLELMLTPEEKKLVSEQGTENIEAYELYLKAQQAYSQWSRERMEQSITIAKQAIALDPQFVKAMQLEAIACMNLYRLWDRNPDYLDRAESLIKTAQEIEPEVKSYLFLLYILQKRFDDAERFVKLAFEETPDDFYVHFMFGFYYFNVGRLEEAALAYERAISLGPDKRLTSWNLVEVLDRSGKKEECIRWAKQALPLFQKWAALHPDDQFAHAQLATFQFYSGSRELALATLEQFLSSTEVDGLSLYTVAVLYMHLNNSEAAMSTLDRAVAAGFSHIELLKSDPNFAPVVDTPEFQHLLERMSQEPA